ncbi:hypothetical protein [Thiocapsa sp.]|uniref:hypothetical protein n=1 Tax=Thiocapsa sp. TaxID=2024551 RepID=UPI0025EF4EC2|nr:hypothetical protein [Thiocapsa sp.]
MSELAVRVQRGELHVNAAHIMTFDGTCENLHGHNFHVENDALAGLSRLQVAVEEAGCRWGIHTRRFDARH